MNNDILYKLLKIIGFVPNSATYYSKNDYLLFINNNFYRIYIDTIKNKTWIKITKNNDPIIWLTFKDSISYLEKEFNTSLRKDVIKKLLNNE